MRSKARHGPRRAVSSSKTGTASHLRSACQRNSAIRVRSCVSFRPGLMAEVHGARLWLSRVRPRLALLQQSSLCFVSLHSMVAAMPTSKALRSLAILATANVAFGNHQGETCSPACTAPAFCHGTSWASSLKCET